MKKNIIWKLQTVNFIKDSYKPRDELGHVTDWLKEGICYVFSLYRLHLRHVLCLNTIKSLQE